MLLTESSGLGSSLTANDSPYRSLAQSRTVYPSFLASSTASASSFGRTTSRMTGTQSDTMVHFLPSHCSKSTGPEPSWSSQVTLTGGDHVGVAGRPPVADEVVHGKADRRRLFHRHLVHDAPARHEDPVGVDPPDLEPRRLLLLARAVHGQERQLEAEPPGQLLEGRVRLLAVGAVVVDVDDLLALELLRPAFLLADVADHRRGLTPVGRREVEHPREPAPVRGGGHAIPHRDNPNL